MINFFKYLFSKRSELSDLDFKDALLAQANVRIYRTRTSKTMEMVPLKYLKLIHSLDRENAKAVLQKRVGELNIHKKSILIDNKIKMVNLSEHLPSVSLIKVVEANSRNFLAFEGNGRIAALKEVFGDKEDVCVEVEKYHFRNKKNIIRKLNRLRKLNGLL